MFEHVDPKAFMPFLGILIGLPMILLRNRRPRVLKPQRMWIMPVLIIVMMGLAIWGTSMTPGMPHEPFGPMDYLVLGLGLILGGLAGWWRGKMTTIEKHDDGTLKAIASPIGLILIIMLMVARKFLGSWMQPHADEMGLNVLAVADAFLLFVVGMVVIQRIEMWIRARRIQAGGQDEHVARLP